ncbi:hypothetical protein [Mongoliimonas terrestris]|uniref:hypothetical protein n=1 Tax=Mongoliimonas terrestris TaxID=1709001 RepID=UPI00094959A4|nr:hypothetical protein [Mongoliimonas terrestris]
MTAGPTGNGWPPDIEGAITAHRKILQVLVALMAEHTGRGADLVGEIEQHLGYQDHQEDPGVEPDAAFAVERAADGEVHRLLRTVRDMIAAADRPSNDTPSSVA